MGDLGLVLNSEDLIDAYKKLVDAASNDDEGGYKRAAATVDRLVYEIGTTPPETMAGIRAKAQAALMMWAGCEEDISSGDRASTLARSLIRDLAWMPVVEAQTPAVRRRFSVVDGGLKASR
jgi:hypothetical protein